MAPELFPTGPLLNEHLRHRPASAFQRALRVAPLLVLLGAAGCAQLGTLKSKVVRQPASSAPAVAMQPAPVEEPVGATSLGEIVNHELQHGRYVEGERDLRRYLEQHPGDHAAKSMLRQVTADPKQLLGAASREHVVQPGESYSTLAARYLGDPNRFVILARYNGSTDPSVLRVGETLHLPLSARTEPSTEEAASPGVNVLDRGTATDASPREDNAPNETSAAKARRLQTESLALLEQGHRQQALARMDEALSADPQLPPAGGAKVAALRTEVVSSYHQRAIVLYRDQQLDQAIALWDRVLAIDPNFEPATVYRTRALELKHRLKQY
jgi:tetratricopeptide (TPR) repeat protein